jgi:glycosyltransferase involved in cell wall biosynthesis
VSAIAVVMSGFPRRSETFALNELLALERAGLLAAVFATKTGDGAPLHPDAAGLAAPVHVLADGDPARQAAAVVERLRGRGVAGVHGYFAHRPAYVAALAAQALGVPSGFSVHARDARKVTPAVLGARASRAACVLACNADVAGDVRRAGGDAEVLPHGVDLARVAPRRARRDGPLGLLAVGRLVEKKGFHVLVDAASRLRAPFRLRIVGDGPERRRLEREVARHGLAADVSLAGPLTHAELPGEYAAADVLVAPSIADASGDRDGLPNVVLEAMACGLPVVAGDIGANASAVGPESGMLVPPGDPHALAAAVELLAAHSDLRERLGRGARARVERDFDLARCTRRLVGRLEEAYA